MKRPTIERLRECLTLDSAGDPVWLVTNSPRAPAGAKAGGKHGFIGLDKFRVERAHVVYALRHGVWPTGTVDPTTGEPFTPQDGSRATTIEDIRKLLKYDPATGVFTWLRRPSLGVQVGDPASPTPHRSTGYMRVRVGGKTWLAHRLAWLLMTGEQPPKVIDHIDGNRANNQWVNLRASSAALNLQNIKRSPAGSLTGVLGASPHGPSYRAQIKINGKSVYIGVYPTIERAHEAYVQAKRRLHPASTL